MTDQELPPTIEPASAPRSRSRTRAAPAQHASTPGRRREIWISLPCGLVAEIDDLAATADRSRARTIELLLRAGINACKRGGEPA
jgi:hypothetical protein